MLLERIQTPGLAAVSYVLGDAGQAVVVDPRRDIDAILEVLRLRQLQPRYVVETHRQEDFVVGSRELARRTGAKRVNSGHRLFGGVDVSLGDGETLEVGGLTLRALHTPGHTPESLCYAVHLGDDRAPVWGVFTGDTLFFGETGRTDLTDPARTAENAELLRHGVHDKLLPLGDGALVLPTHGPGSVCGAHIADRESSTIGIERRENPVFTLSPEAFIRHKLRERLPRPPSFSWIEQLNLGVPPHTPSVLDIPALDPATFENAVHTGAVVIDTRSPEAFAGGHIPGSLGLWLDGLPLYAGWVVGPESRVLLVTGSPGDVTASAEALHRIGIDRVEGFLAGGIETWRNRGHPISSVHTTWAQDAHHRRQELQVLDVREPTEYEAGHIPGSRQMYVGHLPESWRELGLDPVRPVLVTCSVGNRSSLAASLLVRAGFAHVENLLGGMTAWNALNLPVEQSAEGEHGPSILH